jgi:sialic acid synthase SpsE
MPTVIVDVGSTHIGKKEYMHELINRCSDYGVDVVKVQLFDMSYTANGNVIFPRNWWKEMFEYATLKNVGFAASVFDKPALDLVKDYPVPFIKFAYSQQDQPSIQTCIQMGHKVIVTYDLMTVHKAVAGITKLYTVAIQGKTLYPVPFRVDFTNLFPLFDGFSSHCLGTDQEILAVEYGARYLEIHMSLEHKDILVPDRWFAKKPEEVKAIVRAVK